MPVSLLVEGETDEAVARRICSHLALSVGIAYGKRGKNQLLKKLPSYNMAALRMPWFVLVDLDAWEGCTGTFVSATLPLRSPGMRFRVAVRAVEAWLLADKEQLAEFLRVSPARVPDDPDALPHPKQTMVNVARHSRYRAIRDDVVPKEGTGAVVGPLYGARLREFASTMWRPEEAAARSDSLNRCIRAVAGLGSFEPK